MCLAKIHVRVPLKIHERIVPVFFFLLMFYGAGVQFLDLVLMCLQQVTKKQAGSDDRSKRRR